MKLAIYDPKPYANEYASLMFIESVQRFAIANSIPVRSVQDLQQPRNETVVLCTDHLTQEHIQMLKNNSNRIAGFNVTDSSYIAQGIRYAPSLRLVDHIFMLSGIQVVNSAPDFRLTPDFQVEPFDVPFLDEEAFRIFIGMFHANQLHSLPYVPWTPILDVPREPWARRSQKALLRGGGHSRRFLLALHLMLRDKMDINSGFVLNPYFADDMNPAFRYCDPCRKEFKKEHHANYHIEHLAHCNSPAKPEGCGSYSVENLGHWNNRCPTSFFWFAEQFQKHHGKIDMAIVDSLLNAKWIHPKQHMEMLGHILFTSDLKWVHSIYQPQRFWEGASAGCVSVLPERTQSQVTFPKLVAGHHYLTFKEDFKHLEEDFSISEADYNAMARENRHLFEQWMSPTTFPISTNLLKHIIDTMRS